MLIKFVEIQNFRKLGSIRIDLTKDTTLLVGANNSGKTSAMLALGRFLVAPSTFTTDDFTISNWGAINAFGHTWLDADATLATHSELLHAWRPYLPSLDVWLSVRDDELHHVQHILPTLEWSGGSLGVRLQLEPKEAADLRQQFVTAYNAAIRTTQEAQAIRDTQEAYRVKLWPRNLCDFLKKEFRRHFTIRAYLLDPLKVASPVNGLACPQPIPSPDDSVDGNPLRDLIRIDVVGAQRGLRDSQTGSSEELPASGGVRSSARQLSDQLRAYYDRHIDPNETPEPSDLDALDAIVRAQEEFDERLEIGFSKALNELSGLSYPGVTDPRLKILTRLRPAEGLNHDSAVQYVVVTSNEISEDDVYTLPEDHNGLGYNNLISIVFKLMSFRDAWMRVGKASRASADGAAGKLMHPLIHLVLIEEPEAHLHVQVQQAFVRKAYDVLRNHTELRDSPVLQTQVVISTHSSHVAHEVEFSCLRYFRRLPPTESSAIPLAAVVNLTDVFGSGDDTAQFVTRYLRSTHCELFFADAAVLVEGPAERILVPHFIKHAYKTLYSSYVTILEIGGSHAHRLQPLIEHLGLTTLIVTDLDSGDPTNNGKSTEPQRGKSLVTTNSTLLKWHPLAASVDQLLDLSADKKEKVYDGQHFSIRVAFQTAAMVKLGKTGNEEEIIPRTFEDSLLYHNLEYFKGVPGRGLLKKFADAAAKSKTAAQLRSKVAAALADGKKAEFALDVLFGSNVDVLTPPEYIAEGLRWLDWKLNSHRNERAKSDSSTPQLVSGEQNS